MSETIIVRTTDGFATYSGWIINLTNELLTMAVLSEFSAEPVAVIIPVPDIVARTPVAA